MARDINLKYTESSNLAIVAGTIAVKRKFSKEGEVDTDFLNFTAFGKTGETMSKYLKKRK